MNDLNPIPFSVEIVRLEKLLTTYAHGARVIFKYNELEFSGNFCDTSLFDPFDTIEAANRELYPERKLFVFVDFNETANGHYAKKISAPVSSEIIEVAELDWRIRGKTLSNAYQGSIRVDCGIPLLAFSSEQINKKGEYGEWLGELKVWLADEEGLI